MQQILTHPHDEERYKKRSLTISLLFGLFFVILLLIPLLTYPVPPIGQEGILVNLGEIDFGQGDENAAAAAAPVAEEASEATSASEPETEPEPEPEPVEATPPPPPTPEPIQERPRTPSAPDPELLRQQQSELALRERKASEQRNRDREEATAASARETQRKEQERESQRQADAQRQVEARRQAAEAETQRKAAADAKAKALRESTGSLFNGNQGDGPGKGNTGKAGNQGDPNGDPNADRLTGLSSGGTGKVGGGLGSRGVVSSPKIKDSSQRRGKVVISVCVDATGKVTSAEFTQRGSTTSDATLTSLAKENARNYRFTTATSDSQCGNITYEFVVQ